MEHFEFDLSKNKFLIIAGKEDFYHIEDSLPTPILDINIFGKMRDDLEYWKIIIDVKAHSAFFLLSFLRTRAAGIRSQKKETNYWDRFLNSCYTERI